LKGRDVAARRELKLGAGQLKRDYEIAKKKDVPYW
jgi:hypothetical protein